MGDVPSSGCPWVGIPLVSEPLVCNDPCLGRPRVRNPHLGMPPVWNALGWHDLHQDAPIWEPSGQDSLFGMPRFGISPGSGAPRLGCPWVGSFYFRLLQLWDAPALEYPQSGSLQFRMTQLQDT